MSRNDIIQMAREADPDWDYDRDVVEWLARFAALVRADEREACAKVCEEMHRSHFTGPWAKCASTIRARKP